jgi:hypothetical protein
MARFVLAVLIGIGLTLAWQAYGEDAKRIVGPWARDTITSHAPSLASLLPNWTKPQPQPEAEAKKTGSSQTGSSQTGSSPVRDFPADEAIVRPVAAPPVAAPSPELVQRLEAMARDLAAVGRSMEQLAAKQEQIVGRIDTLQTQIEQKLSSAPLPPAPRDNAPRPAGAAARGAPSPSR